MRSVFWVQLSSYLVLVSTAACLQAQSVPTLSGLNSAAPQEQLATTLPAIAARDVAGGFWRTDRDFEPILHIRNVLETSLLKVTPVLWMADGTEYDLPPVTLDEG